MVENEKKTQTKQQSNQSFPHERGSERSERASEGVSSASERANGRASDPVLQSVFLAVIDHSAVAYDVIHCYLWGLSREHHLEWQGHDTLINLHGYAKRMN